MALDSSVCRQKKTEKTESDLEAGTGRREKRSEGDRHAGRQIDKLSEGGSQNQAGREAGGE